MSNRYMLTKEAIEYLAGSIKAIASLPTDVISDNTLATNTTYSSYKINEELTSLEESMKQYSDDLVANLNRLTKKVINDQSLVTEDNVLYLYKADDDESNEYMQMMLINGNIIELGTTKTNLEDYYTMDEIDEKFVIKLDLETLSTSFAELKNKVGTEAVNSVDEAYLLSDNLTEGALEVVSDETEIVENINITLSEANKYGGEFSIGDYVVYQASSEGADSTGLYKHIDDLLDTKANTNHTHTASDITDLSIPTPTTIINSSSTDKEFASTKAVYDSAIKEKNIKTFTVLAQLGLEDGCSVEDIFLAAPISSLTTINVTSSKVKNVPSSHGVLIILKRSTRFSIEFKVSASDSIFPNELYIGQLQGSDGSGLVWNKVITDTDIANLSIPSKTSELENDSNYLSTEDITNTINSTSTETEIPTAKSVNVAIKGKLITQDDIDTYGKEIIKFPVGKWTIGSVAISNLTDLPNSYVRYIEIIGISEVTNPWTNDNTLRSYKATSYKGDTFLRSLNSGSEAGVIASDTGWQRVLLNGDIIDNLTSTDTNKLLSANQGKILNDTKLNKTDANKLNCVVIDNVSLKEYILTNFTVAEGKTYHLIANTTCTDLPKASNFYITVETPGLYTYKVTAKELNDSNGIYVCTYRTISSSWTSWEKVLITGDITTTISNSSTDTQVPSAKAVYNTTSKFLKTYTSIEQLGLTSESETIENIVNSMESRTRLITIIEGHNKSIYPNTSGTLIVEKLNIYRVHFKFCMDGSPTVFVGTYHAVSGFTGWQRLCTTKVKDVPFTTLTVNSWAKGVVVYTVENGICYLWITGLESSTMDTNSQTIVSNLPVPKRGGLWCNIVSSDCTKGGLLLTVTPDGKLQNYSGLNNTTYFGTFSYPVAE